MELCSAETAPGRHVHRPPILSRCLSGQACNDRVLGKIHNSSQRWSRPRPRCQYTQCKSTPRRSEPCEKLLPRCKRLLRRHAPCLACSTRSQGKDHDEAWPHPPGPGVPRVRNPRRAGPAAAARADASGNLRGWWWTQSSQSRNRPAPIDSYYWYSS